MGARVGSAISWMPVAYILLVCSCTDTMGLGSQLLLMVGCSPGVVPVVTSRLDRCSLA